MSSRVYSLQDYCNSLRSIKAKNVPSVAARMARTLMLLPYKTDARKYTADGVEYNRTGHVFDTLWSENVGAQISSVPGIRMEDARYILLRLGDLSSHIIRYGKYYSKAAEFVKSITDSSTQLQKIAYRDWLDFDDAMTNKMSSSGEYYTYLENVGNSALQEKNAATYVELGYYLDQRTLPDPSVDRPYDLYSFLREVATMDMFTWEYVVKNFLTNIKGETIDEFSDLRDYCDVLFPLVDKVTTLILEMEHKIDDIAPLLKINSQSKYEDYSKDVDPITVANIVGFNPSDENWSRPPKAEPLEGQLTNSFRVKEYGKYRISIISKGMSLDSLTLNDNDIDVVTVSYSSSLGAVYLSDVFSASPDDAIFYEMANVSGSARSISVYMYNLSNTVGGGAVDDVVRV